MIKGEMEMRNLQKGLSKTQQTLNLYEDIKFVEMCKTQRTLIISFSCIMVIMILGFFMWMTIPSEVTTETYNQEATEISDTTLNQTIGR